MKNSILMYIHHMVCIEEWRYTDALGIQLSTQKEYIEGKKLNAEFGALFD